MRADRDAVELDHLLEEYVSALEARKALHAAIPERRRTGTAVDLLTAWLVSEEGVDRVDAALKALKDERRALKALAEFARLQVATAPRKAAA